MFLDQLKDLDTVADLSGQDQMAYNDTSPCDISFHFEHRSYLSDHFLKRSHGEMGIIPHTGITKRNTFITVFPRDFHLFTFESSTTDVMLLNNVFAGPGEVFLEHNGKGKITGRNNWIQGGIKDVPEGMEGTISGDGPGFSDVKALDFRPRADSSLIDGGIGREEALAAVRKVTDEAKKADGEVKPSPIWLEAVAEVESATVAYEPIVKGYGFQTRPDDGKTDIGAYEFVETAE